MNIQILQKRVGQRSRQLNDENFDDDIDPDLSNEVEIHFATRDVQTSAKSRQTISRKSSRKSEVETIPSARIVKSRGRPMKPHETEPFLSIDNLPADKTFLSEKSDARTSSSRPASYLNNPPSRSTNDPRTVVVMSPSFTPKQQSKTIGHDLRPSLSARSRSGIRSKSASRQRSGSRQRLRPGSRSQASRTHIQSPLISSQLQLKNPNHHVKSPFKHAVNNKQPQAVLDGRQSPSQDLKERTTQAAFYVNRLMAMGTQKDPPQNKGKLKKGKLKPLYPVNIEGPGINRCRGIVSEARSYAASPSRTLQRRIHLMNTIPNVHEFLMEHRPCTTESVHRTSVVSEDEHVADLQDMNNEGTMDSVRSQLDEDPDPDFDVNTLTSHQTTNDDANNSKDPDVDEQDQSLTDSQNPKMFATELGTRTHETVEGDLTIPPQLLQFHETQDPDQLLEIHDEKSNITDQEQISDLEEHVQRAHSISPSKSVRFAEKSEQSSKDIKEQTNIAKQQQERQGSGGEKKMHKKNKQNLESCKSEDIKEIYKKDDDDDEDVDKNKQNQNKSDSVVKSNNEKDNKSGDTKSREDNRSGSQDQKRSTRNTQPRSHSPLQGRNCSKFKKSSASKPHKNKLQVQTVIHASSTPAIVGPESPSRSLSCSRSGSPVSKKLLDDNICSSPNNFLTSAGDDYDYCSQRSKVKFMIEGEEPEFETIFIEDEENIGLRTDTDITFEAIESQLKSLRHCIRNKLFEQGSDKFELFNEEDSLTEIIEDYTEIHVTDSATDHVIDREDELVIEGRNPSRLEKDHVMDRIQTDYADLIEKYRKKCMDRSELCGAFSERLITPRSHTTYANSNRLMYRERLNKMKNDSSEEYKSKLVENDTLTHVSDSGHGSLDNMSEISRSASLSSSGIPRLNLEGCDSDLDLDSESGSSSKDKDDDSGTVVAEEKNTSVKNILEMVCDDLPPLEPKKNMNRKEMEEDVSKLTVEATKKCLSKQQPGKLAVSKNSSVPFPPLCFTINARPPAGYLYYFAYGPDMNPSRFRSYIKREIDDRFWALLFGFSLVFNKKGTSIEAGGFANLEFNPLRSVEGCLYKITPGELEVLDGCVGYPEHYEHIVLPVWFSNSRDPEQYGVCQYCVPALTYIAQNAWTETETTLPCDYSLSQCIKGADICTQEYRENLVNMTKQIEAVA